MKKLILFLWLVCLTQPALADRWPLRTGWQIAPASQVHDDGARLSSVAYRPHGWLSTSVPSTVLAAEVAAGRYRDIFTGMNFRQIPGTTYPIGHMFSNLNMPKDSPYRQGWWYRTQFQVPSGRRTWLQFGGVNDRSVLWVNGHQAGLMAGAYRTYEFDITDYVQVGSPAAIAVEVFAPRPVDLGITWVDWNPTPADKNMGLWQPVWIATSGPVTVRAPMATTHLVSPDAAAVTITAQVRNATSKPVQGSLQATLADVPIEQHVFLAPYEERSISFQPILMTSPDLWWPAEMGAHPLQTLSVRFSIGRDVSDIQTARVGLREIASELTDKGYRLFKINGRPILIRGAGWSPDMLLRQDSVRLATEIGMVADMHLNTIRLEGKMESDDFFRMTDEAGILVMAGWCCCDRWEDWSKWTPSNDQVAAASLRSQMLRLRSHPSLLVWLNGSDNPPPPRVENAYLAVEKETAWPNPVLSSASGTVTRPTGASGVKMNGPYDYVPPSYWLVDGKYGGAFGFNTETSPGPAIPLVDSLEKFLPADHRWPIDKVWEYHAGGGDFTNLNVFNEAMQATYGMPDNLPDYCRVAQTMQYDAERAMFEAYGRNKYNATGVVQWMLNNAWPSVIWHLFDYYLVPGGGYYGTKKACEPLHVQYSYDDHSVWVVNSRPQTWSGLQVEADLLDIDLHARHESHTVDVDPDGTKQVLKWPDEALAGGLHFVRLELKSQAGTVLSRNCYWVPPQLPVLDWDKTNYTHTPIRQHEDMKALAHLPPAQLQGDVSIKGRTMHVHLTNPSDKLAFQVQLSGSWLWSDNYIELMPGEQCDLQARLHPGETHPTVHVAAWNAPPLILGGH